MMEKVVSAILKKFFGEIQLNDISTLSGGLINQTILINTDKGQFVLQKINQKVFKNIPALIDNKSKVITYLKLNNFPTANFIQTLSNENFCNVDNDIWQISEFIPSVTIDKLNDKLAFKTGKLLAEFHKVLADFPINDLQNTIPDFHNTKKRYAQLKSRLASSSAERIEKAKVEIDFLFENYNKIEPLVDAIDNLEIPMRVVHNDTKVANVLFDANENPICFIDFDTIMPGSILHDIGDALRSGANNSDENEQNLEKVVFNREIYDSFIDGYLSVGQLFMSEIELKNIHMALPLILFEQATRFLEDYLNNDSYYSVDYSEHNLNRTKTQIKLFKELKL